MDIKDIASRVEDYREDMVNTLMELIKRPAVNPRDGGMGEKEKAEFLMGVMEKEFKFDSIERYDAPDKESPYGYRPNIVAYTRGMSDEKRIWVITHMDVVPEGNIEDWKITKPFDPIVKDGKIYGRGSEDNGQSLVASLYAMKALHDRGIKPKYDTYLAFVADEERGSEYGMKYLIKQGLFRQDDLIVVPDAGVEDGSFVEVSEKSILWTRIKTTGKQVHASMPEKGKNAFRAAMRYATGLIDHLYSKFSLRDELFDPPISTFEPTKKEPNVQNINTIPGEDVFYIDSRILPQYDPYDIINEMKSIAEDVASHCGVNIDVETVMLDRAAPPTPPEAEVVQRLKRAIEITRPHIEVKIGGIGGGTCAAIMRRAGYNAVVWSTIDDMAHSPDEYAKIENLVEDAKTFAAFYVM